VTRVSRSAVVLGAFVLLAVAHTWPLALRPAVYSRVDNGDYSLNVWAMDWVAHTLPTDPAHLFDANIFYPARLTLAYSEPLILQGALAIPGAWTGLSPIATFNLVLIAGFALSGWAFALLVHRHTGSWMAGLVAGSAVAFSAHNLVRLVHIQALHLELVPLVFLALDRLLVTGRRRFAALFGAAVALQATASIYLLVFTAWAAAWAAIARIAEWRRRLREAAKWALLSVAACVLVLLPVIWPYVVLARTEGMVRGIGETRRCAASWTDYLYTGSRVHFDAWSHHFGDSSDASFPGLVVTGLAVCGLWGLTRRSPQVRMWLAVVVGSVALSTLPRLPGFEWLHEHMPALGALRCYSRAGQMALIGMGALAGFGAARLLGKLQSARAATFVGIVLVAAVNLEAVRAPFQYREFSGIPAVYDRLRDEPNAVVVELPFYERRSFFANAAYMIYATRYRHPLVNGYSGFVPRDYDATAKAMRAFPADVALERMHQLGVTHVVIHRASGLEQRRAEIDANPALRFVAEQDGIAIFRLVSH
jgi:hypothetical protein